MFQLGVHVIISIIIYLIAIGLGFLVGNFVITFIDTSMQLSNLF